MKKRGADPYENMSKAQLRQVIRSLKVARPPPNDRDQLLLDLETHQIELEMQNRELQEAQQLLEESRDRYANLYDFAPLASVSFDNKGRLHEINLTGATLLGKERSRLIGQFFIQYVAKSDVNTFLGHLRQCEQAHGKVVTEVRLMLGGGRSIEAQLLSVPTRDHENRITLYRTAITDITEHKRAEERRLALERKLLEAQKLESLGVLAGGIAHDFNNLLTIITGNAALALLDLPPDSPARDSIMQIDTAARRSPDLTHQMLAYAGKGRFLVQPIDLSALVWEMLPLLDAAISKTVTLHSELALNLPLINADVTQIRQVVMNLVINGSEAIADAEGTLRLKVGSLYADRAYLDTTYLAAELPEGDYVYLEVTDSGTGMDNDTLGKIFEPFFTTKFTGRGLGLAAVLGIVRGHHGALRVQSTPSRGTIFSLLFPAIDVLAERLSAEPLAASAWRGSGEILVIDDESGVRDLMARILDGAGFTVITAGDGQAGVELFRARADTINCVLLDLTMPRLNGEQAFRAIRQIKPDVRVVLMSGYTEQDVTARFADKELAGFVQKPFTTNELLTKLQQVLNKSTAP